MNFGQLIRSACAFGVSEIFVVGSEKISSFGSQGTTSHVSFRHFPTLALCKEFLVSRGISLIGVEITDTSKSVTSHPFHGDTCFMLGNEGLGMNDHQIAACDSLVYIPQFSSGTASLNVAVAGSIVLHHFALWANFAEADRTGGKFTVSQPRSKIDRYENPTQFEAEIIAQKRAARAAKNTRSLP
jgi:tRNA G18 (ribose-2'-O)-methylase SpoU